MAQTSACIKDKLIPVFDQAPGTDIIYKVFADRLIGLIELNKETEYQHMSYYCVAL